MVMCIRGNPDMVSWYYGIERIKEMSSEADTSGRKILINQTYYS
jgi:hypothetical protein